MRKTRFMIAALTLMAGFLSGCGSVTESIPEPAGTAFDIAAQIISSQTDIVPLMPLSHEEETFAAYLTQNYNILEDGLADGVICYAGGVEASEIAVLVFSGDEAAKDARDTLQDYIERRADSFTGYVPDQAALVENSTAVSHGHYAALLICADPAAAEAAFLSCFEPDWMPAARVELSEAPQPSQPPAQEEADDSLESEGVSEPLESPMEGLADILPSAEPTAGEQPSSTSTDTASPAQEPSPPSAPPTEAVPEPTQAVQIMEDLYDRDAVLAAWRGGDPSGLSDKNRAVYDRAVDAITQVMTDGMTPYQQELAIHDYIAACCRYDSEANSNAPDAAPDPDNGNPYGMLVKGVGICRGYSSTFQLFMDMLGIECITVPGRSGRAEHAWNMVRLDGEWYCVDMTWDDPAGSVPSHRYFNVTSQFLRDTNHQWDEADIPEATADVWAYQG